MKETVINERNGQLIELKSTLYLQISCKIWAFAV